MVAGDAELERLSACVFAVQSLQISGVSSLRPLQRLRSVRERLRITNSDALVSLAGLNALERAGGLHLSRLPNVSDLRGLDRLTALGSLDLWGHIADPSASLGITSLKALSGLRGSLSAVNISDVTKLRSLDGLENISELGTLYVFRNPALADLRGLAGVSRVQDLEIGGNPLLPSCAVNAFATRVGATNRESAPNGAQACVP
jgi:hypothetical protein